MWPSLKGQSWPLARAVAPWLFQLSLLSSMTPRNFAVLFEGMRWLPIFRAVQGDGTLFFLMNGCGTIFLVKSSSWNFLILNLQLCVLAHARILFVLSIMSCSFLWVSVRDLPVAMIAALSTKSSICSPSFISAILGRSETVDYTYMDDENCQDISSFQLHLFWAIKFLCLQLCRFLFSVTVFFRAPLAWSFLLIWLHL